MSFTELAELSSLLREASGIISWLPESELERLDVRPLLKDELIAGAVAVEHAAQHIVSVKSEDGRTIGHYMLVKE